MVFLSDDMISISADKTFSSVGDGLLRVDLTKTDPQLLNRYMGKKGFEIFTRYHHVLAEDDQAVNGISSKNYI